MVGLLDRQHTGKSPYSTDMGAWADLDGDSVHDLEEQEAMLTPQYLRHAELRLRLLDHVAIPMSDGSYADRHARAARYARQMPSERFGYIAAHFNSSEPSGDYGAIFYDYRSQGGAALAGLVATALRASCPELATVKVLAARHDDWTKDAYATIEGIWAGPGNISGVCFEPCFMNQPLHRALLLEDGLRRIGHALADGLNAWGSP